MEHKSGIISYIQNVSLFLLGVLFMIFPVVFSTISTNPIVLPKQILLIGVVSILLILQAVKMISERSVKLRRTPFDIPLIMLAIFAFISSLLSQNRVDSIMAFIPFFFAILAFFLIINIVKDRSSLLFFIFSLIIGGILLSLSAVLSFFKIYTLPFAGTQVQTFTPLGSLLDQEIYLILMFAVSFFYLWKLFMVKNTREKNELDASYSDEEIDKEDHHNQRVTKSLSFGLASFIILMGIVVTTYSLFKLEKPTVLPIETGFQTAFSEISLNSDRLAQSFLFGSGFGTYATDFTRWKQVAFNQNSSLWNLTFFRSSDFVLEILATTGVLGLSALLFLLVRVVREIKVGSKNKINLALISLFIITFLLPMGFSTQTMFFIILGLFAANQGLFNKTQGRFFDIELQLVAFKKGLIALEAPKSKNEKSIILPGLVTLLILALVGYVGYFGTLYVLADLSFQQSLVAASQNNGSLTYQKQAQAISTFKYRDSFYRIFSQTNLALANALASQQQSSKASPSATTQQDITKLIQQSIDSARAASTISPQTPINWQNLSSIYRSLIGFGQNAENFAIATAQQGIKLDPNNPQGYIILGGIYYQLGQWDNAQNQFQIAVALKSDFANAHYNLGHALEEKGDLQNAIAQYQIVKNLVSNDKTALEKIDKEIEALQNKTSNEEAVSNEQNQALNISQPTGTLPPQNPPVKIPAPSISSESAK